ncbi:alpha/beta hydrolase family protein [Rhodococcus sp. G-MC3]|uniref:alpha/beta hydrolase n=1 Tax=Rhodococcus sp. G-MC3 TaxID=3046209 RepID=UPI0024BA7CB7|nr:alpha/beta hydrolase family protein [Rhodococcus sp. G-MC3]MDJ0394798.1 alpha/beta hydrolase family protein [Rhodococcus sp. G-MC3]
MVYTRHFGVLCAVLLFGLVGAPAVSSAQSSGASIENVEVSSETLTTLAVYSPSMDRIIDVQVLTPAVENGPRPSLYMLSGIGEEDLENSMWLRKGGAAEFFEDKNVNVVLPLAGPGSFYADWQQDDPKLGRYQWETFLTKELPPLIDAEFDGNGRNGVAGLSMGAQSAMILAARNPSLYSAVAAYSGCFSSAEVLGQGSMRGIVSAFGGDANNMFGGPLDPDWAAHDVLAQAENLRNTAIYVSVGSGLAGPYERFDTAKDWDIVMVGGAIEMGANYCTHRLDDKLRQLGVPATFDFEQVGTHSWAYWVDQLPKSWPTLSAGLGL